MTVLLADDSGASLELDDCAAGYLVSQVEVGAPETRAVVDPRTMADGVNDRTRFVGQRAITVTVRLVPVPQRRIDLLDALGAFLHPGQRLWLTLALDDAVPRVYRVRADDWSSPWERPTDNEMTLSWQTAGGQPWAMSLDQRTVALVPTGGADTGRDYHEAPTTAPWLEHDTGRTYDREYPPAAASVAPVVNAGNVPTEWVARVYGPLQYGFVLRNITTGQQLSLPRLSIPGGQSVEFDSLQHTIRANGDPSASRYGYLDFAASQWFTLVPGVNQIAVESETFTAPHQTHMVWRDAYMI